jgi:hypothetical protein
MGVIRGPPAIPPGATLEDSAGNASIFPNNLPTADPVGRESFHFPCKMMGKVHF